MFLYDEIFVCLHGNEEAQGRPKCKEVINLMKGEWWDGGEREGRRGEGGDKRVRRRGEGGKKEERGEKEGGGEEEGRKSRRKKGEKGRNKMRMKRKLEERNVNKLGEGMRTEGKENRKEVERKLTGD